MKSILIIHPHDKSTNFLLKIKNYLLKNLDDSIHYYNVKPCNESHSKCLDKIKNMPQNSLIIFMGHGMSNALYGSKSDNYGSYSLASRDALNDSPEIDYYNTSFITQSNINVFNNKLVFCLSCNSKGLSSAAINNGAKAFIGFGNIPTSKEEFKEENISYPSKYLIAQIKTEINYIIKNTLLISIKNSYNFDQLYNLLYFFINKRISHHLVDRRKKKERYIITDYLYYFKKELTISGNKKTSIYIHQ